MVVFFSRYRCKGSANALPWLLQEGAEVGCCSSGTKIQMDCINHRLGRATGVHPVLIWENIPQVDGTEIQ